MYAIYGNIYHQYTPNVPVGYSLPVSLSLICSPPVLPWLKPPPVGWSWGQGTLSLPQRADGRHGLLRPPQHSLLQTRFTYSGSHIGTVNLYCTYVYCIHDNNNNNNNNDNSKSRMIIAIIIIIIYNNDNNNSIHVEDICMRNYRFGLCSMTLWSHHFVRLRLVCHV